MYYIFCISFPVLSRRGGVGIRAPWLPTLPSPPSTEPTTSARGALTLMPTPSDRLLPVFPLPTPTPPAMPTTPDTSPMLSTLPAMSTLDMLLLPPLLPTPDTLDTLPPLPSPPTLPSPPSTEPTTSARGALTPTLMPTPSAGRCRSSPCQRL